MKRFVMAAVILSAAQGGCKKKQEDPAAAPVKPAMASAMAVADDAATAPAVDPKLVARGAYVANVAGCVLCHTALTPTGPDMANAWGGGLEMTEKFGTWKSPNISPDKASGIGGWTDEQIILAIREGVRPDGSRLYPIMPYLFYNAMSNDDAAALVAFMRTLSSVSRQVGRNDLKLPQIPAPKAVGATPAADPVKQGEYLSTLMHCALCHTPMSDSGMPDMARANAGGFEFEMPPMFGTGTLYSANITSDPETGLGKWSDDEIRGAIFRGLKKDGSPVMGPMQMYLAVWSTLTDADQTAVVAYVRSLAPIKNKVAKSTFKPAMPPGGPGGPHGPIDPVVAPPAEPGAPPAAPAKALAPKQPPVPTQVVPPSKSGAHRPLPTLPQPAAATVLKGKAAVIEAGKSQPR
jgi:hypothetical protein